MLCITLLIQYHPVLHNSLVHFTEITIPNSINSQSNQLKCCSIIFVVNQNANHSHQKVENFSYAEDKIEIYSFSSTEILNFLVWLLWRHLTNSLTYVRQPVPAWLVNHTDVHTPFEYLSNSIFCIGNMNIVPCAEYNIFHLCTSEPCSMDTPNLYIQVQKMPMIWPLS